MSVHALKRKSKLKNLAFLTHQNFVKTKCSCFPMWAIADYVSERRGKTRPIAKTRIVHVTYFKQNQFSSFIGTEAHYTRMFC